MDEMKDMPQENSAKPITILITLLPSGNVDVESPVLHNKLLCYGLLKGAEFAIAMYQPEGAIVQPQGGILGFARKIKKRF